MQRNFMMLRENIYICHRYFHVAFQVVAQISNLAAAVKKKPGTWGGISFKDSSIDAKFDDAGNYVSGSILQYCTVEHAETGVNVHSSSPFIDHCVISNNAGRGIFVFEGNTVLIQNSMIRKNRGGICILDSRYVTLTGNTIEKNNAVKKKFLTADGGGIKIKVDNIEDGKIIIKDNTLSWNTASAPGSGGGIYIRGGTAFISNNTLTQNEATGTIGGGPHTGHGGAIYIDDTTVATVSNNILCNNWAAAYSYGGGIWVGGTATINNNILCGNSSLKGQGGGIYVCGQAEINNNVLTGNWADGEGGAIYVGVFKYSLGILEPRQKIAKMTKITDNVISENHISDSNGAAIYYSGSKEINGNVIANNVAEGDIDSRGAKRGENLNAVFIDGNPPFTGNTIIGNQTEYSVYYSESKGSPNLNATNNYWGVTTEGEIRVKIYDVFADDSKALVEVNPFLTEDPLPLGSLTVITSPKVLTADGVSNTTITARLNDSKGNPVVDEPLTIVASRGKGKLSKVYNKGDGTYTAIYTVGKILGTEKIWVIAPKQKLAKPVEIELTKIKKE